MQFITEERQQPLVIRLIVEDCDTKLLLFFKKHYYNKYLGCFFETTTTQYAVTL